LRTHLIISSSLSSIIIAVLCCWSEPGVELGLALPLTACDARIAQNSLDFWQKSTCLVTLPDAVIGLKYSTLYLEIKIRNNWLHKAQNMTKSNIFNLKIAVMFNFYAIKGHKNQKLCPQI